MDPLGTDDPRVIGEFRLQARLGAGGMGRVYLGYSLAGRAVAVKVIHPQIARDAAFVDRFRREVAAAQAVNGAYAAPVIAAGPDDNPPWLATAFVPGPTLQDAVAVTGPLPTEAVWKLIAGLAEALRVIHACGLVHRDLKPGNVLLAPDGPRVIDFGIARALDGTVLTSAESMLGTPSFMSPEQAQGKPAGPASDVFSLGCLLYFAATGTNPFGTGLPAVMLYRIVHTEPDLDRLPPRLRELAAACLAKDPAGRPGPAKLATELMTAAPSGASPIAFWPGPVAKFIRDYGAQLDLGLSAAFAGPADAASSLAGAHSAASPVAEGPAPRVNPASQVNPAPRVKQPPVPGMGRRRALATLAGMAAGGLAVAGWDLARSRKQHAAAGHLAAQRHLTARRHVASKPPGTEIWRTAVNGGVASVAVANGVVYAGTGEDTVFALDAVTGKQIWRRATAGQINYQLAAAGDVIIVGSDSDTYALETGTGKQRWIHRAGDGPLGLKVVGDVVYAGIAVQSDTTGGVTAWATGTGELLWTYTFPEDTDTNGSLTVAGGVVYATTSNGEIFAIDAASGNKLWRIAVPKIQFGAGRLIVAGGVSYVSSDLDTGSKTSPVLYAFDLRTRRQLWKFDLGDITFPGELDVADGVVFVGTLRDTASAMKGVNGGAMYAVNGATGQRLWGVPVGSGVGLAPVVAGDVVYSGTGNGTLQARQARTGNVLWSYRAGGNIGSSLVLSDGAMYFGSADNHVYAVAAQR